MNNFKNGNLVTKIRLSSHNLAVSTTKWYNPQRDTKICKGCRKMEIEDEIDGIFSRDKYDIIRRVVYNGKKLSKGNQSGRGRN